MFFFGYEGLKKTLSVVMPDPQHAPLVHMMSATGGEIVSFLFVESLCPIATQNNANAQKKKKR